jgi:hypothetical protein
MSTLNGLESVTEPLAVSIDRAAAMVGVTGRHLRTKLDIEGGPIRTVRMGNRVLIPVESLRDYLKPPAEPTPAVNRNKKSRARR